MSGEIPKEKYELKKAELDLEKLNAITDINQLDTNSELLLERKIALLELSQKASFIYRFKTIESKRIIITKLFEELTYKDGSVSVKYTKFANAIAKNVRNTSVLTKGQI